jgi:hypothetical protein
MIRNVLRPRTIRRPPRLLTPCELRAAAGAAARAERPPALGIATWGNRASGIVSAGKGTAAAGASISARIDPASIATYGSEIATIPTTPNQKRCRRVPRPPTPSGRVPAAPPAPAKAALNTAPQLRNGDYFAPFWLVMNPAQERSAKACAPKPPTTLPQNGAPCQVVICKFRKLRGGIAEPVGYTRARLTSRPSQRAHVQLDPPRPTWAHVELEPLENPIFGSPFGTFDQLVSPATGRTPWSPHL